MVKHTQRIRRQFADELFERVDHFVWLTLKGLSKTILVNDGRNDDFHKF